MKKIICTIIAVWVLAAIPSLTMAKDSMLRSGWWRSPKMAELIQLTDEEKQQLNDKFNQSRRARIELRSAVEAAQLELDVLLDKNAVDDAVMKQYKKVEDARSQLAEEIFNFYLETRKVVGAERFGKLRETAQQWRHGRQGDSRRIERRSSGKNLSRPNFGPAQ